MARDKAIADKHAWAREQQQEAEVDHMVAMADEATEENYNVVKLRIWARQWRAAKLAPKKYGERTTTDVNVKHSLEDLVLGSMGRRKDQLEPPTIILPIIKSETEDRPHNGGDEADAIGNAGSLGA